LPEGGGCDEARIGKAENGLAFMDFRKKMVAYPLYGMQHPVTGATVTTPRSGFS
jgi:hypothetical protein